MSCASAISPVSISALMLTAMTTKLSEPRVSRHESSGFAHWFRAVGTHRGIL